MLCPFEKAKLFEYISNIISYNKIQKDDLLSFISSNKDLFHFDVNGLVEKYFDVSYNAQKNSKVGYRLYNDFKAYVDKKNDSAKNLKPSKVENNLRILADLFNLCDDEKEIVGIYIRYQSEKFFEDLIDDVIIRNLRHGQMPLITKQLLNMTEAKWRKIFNKTGNLLNSGLLSSDNNSLSLSSRFDFISQYQLKTSDDIKKYILSDNLIAAKLQLDDFVHLSDNIDNISKIITSNKKKNINILFYGPPGTGKTELSKSICAQIGYQLYNVGVNIPEADEPNRRQRMSDLQLFQSILSKYQQRDKNDKYCLLFDEAEDFFDRGGGLFMPKQGSKVYMNDMLESNNLPVFWCTNNIEQIDVAFLRRFDYILEMKNPTVFHQVKTWKKQLQQHQLTLSDIEIKDLITTYKTSPAIIEKATQMAKINNGDISFFHSYLGNIYKATYQQKPKIADNIENIAFNDNLINTSLPLQTLTKNLAEANHKDFSLCLYGVSGTGKSAYAKYLSTKLQMEALYKKASDIIDCYVGVTEKNIARAFEEAMDNDAVLIIDEADSFLRDRQLASKSWEVTAVNEMLTQMEQHPLPFICSTNLFADIDKASLRRFTFKIKYDYLTLEQTQLAFKYFFGFDVELLRIRHLDCVTPGDFAVTHKQAKILGLLDNHASLISMFENIMTDKNIKPKIGFGV